ncbi:hypothetical protein GGQ79_004708 [Ochrobactrum pecoris]|uniref:Uncharacterized protein n=1 Tax=Brucella pecoris TaxID=867683 RepID=A0AB34YXT7_9HYPH|nr:hypothetical protein [Brucella pecoris]
MAGGRAYTVRFVVQLASASCTTAIPGLAGFARSYGIEGFFELAIGKV